jgi:hypothetical protein
MRWDFKCPKCGRVKELTFRSVEDADAAKYLCDKDFCKNVVVRQPSAPNFKVKGFNAANGYTS